MFSFSGFRLSSACKDLVEDTCGTSAACAHAEWVSVPDCCCLALPQRIFPLRRLGMCTFSLKWCMPTGLAGEEVNSARCHYGTLPGGWLQTERRALLPQPADNSTDAVFPVWQPFCGKCQLKPLLTPYLVVYQALPAVHLSICPTTSKPPCSEASACLLKLLLLACWIQAS